MRLQGGGHHIKIKSRRGGYLLFKCPGGEGRGVIKS